MSVAPNSNILPVGQVLSTSVDVASLDSTVARIIEMTRNSQAAYVCVANVHMVVTSEINRSFRRVMNSASIIASDGMPLVWELKRQGYSQAERVSGPDLMQNICTAAQTEAVPIYFYGGSDQSAKLFETKLRALYPSMLIAGVDAPSLLPDKPTLDTDLVRKINASGAKIVFIGLGCPKQEYWMHAHTNQLNAVLIGVGAAFDFFTGSKKRAPVWMQRYGLEWFFRLCSEPRRLWRRYLVTNMTFLYLLLKSWFMAPHASVPPPKNKGE